MILTCSSMLSHNHSNGFGTQTPASNTGVTSIEQIGLRSSVDWLSGTFEQSQMDSIKDFLVRLFSDCFFPEPGAQVGFYQKSYRSVHGIIIGFEPFQNHLADFDRTDAYLSIPGNVLSMLPLNSLHRLFTVLNEEYSFKCSRLDVCIDDFEKRVTALQLFKYYKKGYVFGFRTYHYHDSGKNKDAPQLSISFGQRGKKGAGKYLRCYDKEAESNGRIKSFRFELELSGERSRVLFQYFCAEPFESWSNVIKGIMSASIDFVSGVTHTKADGKRMKFWHQIVGDSTQISFTTTKKKPVLSKKVKWLRQQVAPTLALIGNAFGSLEGAVEWFCGLITNGESRLTKEQLALIDFASRGQYELAT